ncbi:hypothetical protein HDU92_005908 [Lobulomyces angularis]|nr:hypothetical protein HDU92_005908 [Lobulomyces angularis]
MQFSKLVLISVAAILTLAPTTQSRGLISKRETASGDNEALGCFCSLICEKPCCCH